MGPWCDPCTYQGVLSPGLCLCGQAGGLGRVRSRSDVPRIWVLPEPPRDGSELCAQPLGAALSLKLSRELQVQPGRCCGSPVSE